jgi:hypothetical protein
MDADDPGLGPDAPCGEYPPIARSALDVTSFKHLSTRKTFVSSYEPEHFEEAVTIGPLWLFFTNVNDEMALPGHSHAAELVLTYRNLGPVGFPAFDATVRAVQERLVELTRLAFRNATNEEVLRRLFAGFDGWSHPSIDTWHSHFELIKAQLGVQGVLDHIGHADGVTWYTIKRKAR